MRRVGLAAAFAVALSLAGTAQAKDIKSTLPPPGKGSTMLTVTSPCDTGIFTGSTACAGYYDGNLINGSPTDITNAQNAIAGLPGGLTWDGNWASVDPTKVETLTGNVLDFGQTLFGLTVIGAHFGNVNGPAGNVSGFWLFDFGTQGASSVALNYPEGFSNAAVYLTGDSPAVPEPATWAMMLFGFGVAGYALRRRRQPKLAQLA
ncbi:hypothetical protein GCM10023264_24940 [Sphingomonas daechungensis]|uniref:PEPxxWA-CTERM sorting domain-containing protein n=1 Tax=Sphingomonas daechungensis TaxID=1176646 RepID=UPI001CB90171|nr:PEPxxWA-CTERM sorting domain-containing protein [Sphingomonas daechungensis]